MTPHKLSTTEHRNFVFFLYFFHVRVHDCTDIPCWLHVTASPEGHLLFGDDFLITSTSHSKRGVKFPSCGFQQVGCVTQARNYTTLKTHTIALEPQALERHMQSSKRSQGFLHQAAHVWRLPGCNRPCRGERSRLVSACPNSQVFEERPLCTFQQRHTFLETETFMIVALGISYGFNSLEQTHGDDLDDKSSKSLLMSGWIVFVFQQNATNFCRQWDTQKVHST